MEFKRSCNTWRLFLLALFFSGPLLSLAPLMAHHGVASLGMAGLLGPGAPVESSTSATLPTGSILGYFKADHARFETFSPGADDEALSSTFLMAGGGYGFTSYLSGYLFVPYNIKKREDNSFNTASTADLSVMLTIGFRYDGTLRPVPEGESLDDQEDWHFTLYTGASLPTGDPNVRNSSYEIDPGMSTGFGSSSYSIGVAATKMVGRWTFINDISYISFDPYRYEDGSTTRFGSEFRYNLAFTWRGYTNDKKKFRIDPVLEFNFLRIARDRTRGMRTIDLYTNLAALEGIPVQTEPMTSLFPDTLPPWEIENAIARADSGARVPPFDPWGLYASMRGTVLTPSGGDTLYLLPGFRIYKNNISIALGVKVPVRYLPDRVPLHRNLILAYLQGSYNGDITGALRDTWWDNQYLKERLSQGSEGTERYRILFTLSFLV